MGGKTVFISYSHDSAEHAERVRGLHASLSRDGCTCRLDVFKDSDEDWPTWMTRQLLEADFILCVVTETYERRFRDKELPDVGRGVGWEATLIRRLLYSKKLHNDSIFPVIFSGTDRQHTPIELADYDLFTLTGDEGYVALLRKLLNRPQFQEPVAGSEPDLPTTETAPLFARPGTQTSATTQPRIPTDIARISKYAPTELVGREGDLEYLDSAWAKVQAQQAGRPHLITYVAMGGEGKTSLVAKWLALLAGRDWPGCSAAFAWSFYSQGTSEQTAASSDLFLNEALAFFGDAAFAASSQGAHAKGQRLAELAGQAGALLVLDGLEPLQYPPTSPVAGELRDQGLKALLKGLAANSRGLCIVTTRVTLPDLNNWRTGLAPEIALKRLSNEAGVHLLKSLGVKGNQQEYEEAVEAVKGHALTLNLLGSWLRDAHNGDIRQRGLVKLAEADDEEQNGHAFRVMDAYATWLKADGEKGQRALALLQLLGLFDRPASAGCLEALLKPPAIAGLTEPLVNLPDTQRNLTLTRLQEANLLTVKRDSAGRLLELDAHPLLREYFARRLQSGSPDSWRAAHKRLYEHLCTSSHEGDAPTLEQLQPLYQAVAHGSLAGLQQEACEKVYRDRILKGTGNDGFYSSKKLGAFGSDLGAVACFFDQPWSRLSPNLSAADQAWLLAVASFDLRALGRLPEAVDPMRAGMENFVRDNQWTSAAVMASNLSELELTIGLIAEAAADGALSVEYADKSGAADWQNFIRTRTTHADVLFHSGQRQQALELFAQVELMQAKWQPDYPLLYSLRGFRYCDLLLAAAERSAWLSFLECGDRSPLLETRHVASSQSAVVPAQSKICREVAKRAEQSLKIVLNGSRNLLDIALNHLTLGRAALYARLLGGPSEEEKLAATHLTAAVDGLIKSGNMDDVPRGLLTRAWFRAWQGDVAGAQSDLDEAWEIAERGPMALFMADIHLHRARLFAKSADYPWQSVAHDLAEVRRLIEKHGYLRRKEELEDAEAALLVK